MLKQYLCGIIRILILSVAMLLIASPDFHASDSYAQSGSGSFLTAATDRGESIASAAAERSESGYDAAGTGNRVNTNRGAGADDRKENLLQVYFYYTPCWKKTEQVLKYSDWVGDGAYEEIIATNGTFDIYMCDQCRVSIKSLMGNETKCLYTSSNESILEISDDGGLIMHKTGRVVVTVSAPGNEKYRDCTVRVPVYVMKLSGFMTSPIYNYTDDYYSSFSIDTSDEPKQIATVLMKPGAHVTYSSRDPQIAEVDENGFVTAISPGTTRIYIDGDAGDHGLYEATRYTLDIVVTGADTRSEQTIGGCTDCIEVGCNETVSLQLTAKTPLSYKSKNPSIASVSSDGTIRGIKAGTTVITVNAEPDKNYLEASKTITVHVRDYAAEETARREKERQEDSTRIVKEQQGEDTRKEEAARKEQEQQTEAARKEQEKKDAILQAKSLKAPKLKCSAGKNKVRITWSKVTGASGYQLYVKYPGTKKYVKALTKDATVKSVKHRGLSSKMKYSYKVRAFAVVDGKYYYGPFSKAKTVKVK